LAADLELLELPAGLMTLQRFHMRRILKSSLFMTEWLTYTGSTGILLVPLFIVLEVIGDFMLVGDGEPFC
jgi:hypothetical protein